MGEGLGRMEDALADVDVDGDGSDGVDGEVSAARDRAVDERDGGNGEVGEGEDVPWAFASEGGEIKTCLLVSVPPPLAPAPEGARVVASRSW